MTGLSSPSTGEPRASRSVQRLIDGGRRKDKRPRRTLVHFVRSADRRCQFARATSTRLSEKDGAWPMSVKAPDEMLLTVPSLSWRQ